MFLQAGHRLFTFGGASALTPIIAHNQACSPSYFSPVPNAPFHITLSNPVYCPIQNQVILIQSDQIVFLIQNIP